MKFLTICSDNFEYSIRPVFNIWNWILKFEIQIFVGEVNKRGLKCKCSILHLRVWKLHVAPFSDILGEWIWHNSHLKLPFFDLTYQVREFGKDTRCLQIIFASTTFLAIQNFLITILPARICLSVHPFLYTGCLIKWSPQKVSDYIVNPIKKVLSVRIYLPAGTF